MMPSNEYQTKMMEQSNAEGVCFAIAITRCFVWPPRRAATFVTDMIAGYNVKIRCLVFGWLRIQYRYIRYVQEPVVTGSNNLTITWNTWEQAA
jgi:hypothetical protein